MELVFQECPDVMLGSCVFRNIPTIIQHKDTPVLEVGKFVAAGYTTRLSIYNSDGVHIAVLKGSQIYPTEAGKKANIRPVFEPNLTVCELEGRPILELRRQGAAALRGYAELYAPEGVLITAAEPRSTNLVVGEGELIINGSMLVGADFENRPIGIHFLEGKTLLAFKHMQYFGPPEGWTELQGSSK